MSRGILRSLAAVTGLWIVVASARCASSTRPPAQAQARPGDIHGSVFASPSGSRTRISIAGFVVSVKRSGDGQLVASATTDVDGHYHFNLSTAPENLQPGSYQVCWSGAAGWQDGCVPGVFVLDGQIEYAHAAEIRPVDPAAVVWGRVTIGDRTPCASVGNDQNVSVRARSGTKQATGVNRNGFFVLPNVSTTAVAIDAKCGNLSATESLTARPANGAARNVSIHLPAGPNPNVTVTPTPPVLPDGVPPYSGYPSTEPFIDDTFSPTGNAYYDSIGAGDVTTLGQWWRRNNFTSTGGLDISQGVVGARAAYFNRNDLAFWRDMHCSQKGTGNAADIACYVSNYKDPDSAVRSDQAAAFATVAMERRAADHVVKFFVFGGGLASSARSETAVLDDFGNKPVPGVCLACHGRGGTGSSFREFDLVSFDYSTLAGASRSEQEVQFKLLNQIVAQTSPAPAIQELIQGWYANSAATQVSTYVPSGWIDPQNPSVAQLYRNVVAKSCRTCHVALGPKLDWSSYQMFSQWQTEIADDVCGTNKVMPHSFVTYKNFWLSSSPNSPTALAEFSGQGWTTLSTCK